MSTALHPSFAPTGEVTAADPRSAADWPIFSWLARFAIWALPVITFTTPGRASPLSLALFDGLALVKAMILLAVLGGALPLLAALGSDSRARRTLLPLLPFLLFLGWAILSVLWSPLRAVSLGQTGGLASLLLLASFVAFTCQHAPSLERMLKTLSHSLLAFSLVVLVIHFLAPNYSGLDRRMLVTGSDGMVHPTAAGANASLGLLLAVLCRLVGRYPWSTRFLIASLLIHGTILFYASSRAALGMAAITIPLVVFFFTTNATRARVLLLFSCLTVTWMLFDPAFQGVFEADSAGIQYLTRGQSTDQLKSVSGRSEMWTAIWKEFKKSIWIGHGYFVTSEKGAVEVWDMKANHTAHNIYLQVLVSTGVIGLALFLLAVLRSWLGFLTLRVGDKQDQQVLLMLLFVSIWYAGWSLFSASFMGPIRSESVFFFAFLGLGVGHWSRCNQSPHASFLPAPSPSIELLP